MNTTNTRPTQAYDGVTDLVPINMWFVEGIRGEFFTNKLAAETRAAKAFPHEDPDRRYARVFYRRFFREV
jgi:hypothetical protein